MDCAEARANLWEYLDDELPTDDWTAVQAHLALCRRCHLAYCFDRGFLQRLALLTTRLDAPPALRIRVQQLLRSTQPH